MRTKRVWIFVLMALAALFIIGNIANLFDKKPSALSTSPSTGSGSSGAESAAAPGNANAVPWDYRIGERTVGDLINGDMSLQPDNQLLPNDENYATGDQIWVLESMDAVTTPRPDGSSDIRLTAWKPVKSYKTKDSADSDLANLKEQVQTDVELVGVYKTEMNGKFREFAIIRLPSGSEVKQPIDEARYADFKSKKQVKVQLEIIHDMNNYDLAMPKFRGWSA